MVLLAMVFGCFAILTAVCNLILSIKGKQTDILRFVSISFTALTVCAFYSVDAQFVAKEDWSALMDVAPSLSKLCRIGTVCSVALNGCTFFFKKKS